MMFDNRNFSFQSLSGFLMRCDIRSGALTFPASWFQSLSGFLMRCDRNLCRGVPLARPVSIPIGFSDAL